MKVCILGQLGRGRAMKVCILGPFSWWCSVPNAGLAAVAVSRLVPARARA